MEYVFGSTLHGGVDCENLKTVGIEHSNLTGRMTIVRKYNDSEINDTFEIVEKYHSDESDGLFYDWYIIKNHSRWEDRFSPGIVSTEQEITDHDLAIIEAEQEITELDLKIWELENMMEV